MKYKKLFTLTMLSFLLPSCTVEKEIVYISSSVEEKTNSSEEDVEKEVSANSSEEKKPFEEKTSSSKEDEEKDVGVNSSEEKQKVEEKEIIPLKSIEREGKKYYYGSLKDAGYKRIDSSTYLKDDKKYEIKKYDNYQGMVNVSRVDYLNRRKDDNLYFADENGSVTTDISKANRHYYLKEDRKEVLHDGIKESYEISDKKVYEFSVYKTHDEKKNTFSSEVVDDCSFIKDYSSYQVLNDIKFSDGDYQYYLAKFYKSAESFDYRYIRHRKEDSVDFKYKSGYKVTTFDVKDDLVKPEYVPIIIGQGKINDNNCTYYRESFSPSICNNCLSPVRERQRLIKVFIPYREYISLYNMTYNHDDGISEYKKYFYDDDKSISTLLTVFYHQGGYIREFQDAIYKPSVIRVNVKGDRWTNRDEIFYYFDSVDSVNCTNEDYKIMFNLQHRTYYSPSFVVENTRKYYLPKMRTHLSMSSYHHSFLLKKVNDGSYDTFTLRESNSNTQGLFIDKNIEISSISRHDIKDMYEVKRIISEKRYAPNEEIKDSLEVKEGGVLARRNEIDNNNNINVYEHYIDERNIKSIYSHEDEFLIRVEGGLYSFKYDRVFKENVENDIDYFYMDDKKMRKEDLSCYSMQAKITDLKLNTGEKSTLYTIEEI